jgi:hypothetical protein
LHPGPSSDGHNTLRATTPFVTVHNCQHIVVVVVVVVVVVIIIIIIIIIISSSSSSSSSHLYTEYLQLYT